MLALRLAQEVLMTQRKDRVEGEGSYSGTKDYNERQRKFMESGNVEDAAREAQPRAKARSTRCRKRSASASSTRRARTRTQAPEIIGVRHRFLR